MTEDQAWFEEHTEVTYSTGDVVWVNNRTNKGVLGMTHDGVYWFNLDDPPKNSTTQRPIGEGKNEDHERDHI